MTIKRLSRILVCLVLVLSLLVGISPLKAHASAVAAIPIAVPVVAPLVLGAVIIGLGIMCAADAGVFDGVISKCQEALSSSGLITDGQMDVISYDGKAYVSSDTVEAVRSALFSTAVIKEGLYSSASVSAGSKFTSKNYGECTIMRDCCAFLCQYGNLSTREIVVLHLDGSSPDVIYPDGSYLGLRYAYLSSCRFTYVYEEVGTSGADHLSLPCVSYSGSIGDVVKRFYNGELSFSPTTTVVTDYDVTLGNVGLADEKIQTEYDTWVQFGIVFEDTGNTRPPNDEDDEFILPIEVLEDPSDLYGLTQSEVQDGGELIVETPGGTTSGSGISETWLGQKLDALGDWLSGIKESIIELPSKFATWFGDLITGIETLGETITNAWNAAIEAILNGIRDIFVPSEDFLTEKVEALRAKFSFADSIITSGQYIGNSLQGLGTEPPVIYLNLANNRGPYDLGGEVAFLDLRWYEEYKPVGDATISAFLWLLFVWRLYVKAPGIIRGLPGDVQTVKDFRDNGGK